VTIDMNSRDAARNHNQSARNALIVKFVFMLTLIAAIGGWLWLLGKGAVAVARAMSSV
jgi:hypothetical protein